MPIQIKWETERPLDYRRHEVLVNPFSTVSDKSVWYYPFREQLTRTQYKDEFRFRANMNPHGLTNTKLTLFIPALTCNPGHEARWVCRVGLRWIKTASTLINGEVYQQFDGLGIDMHEPMSEWELCALGNINELTTWSSQLPSYPATVKVPWFYDRLRSMFPLYRHGVEDTLEHRLTLEDLTTLLQVRRCDDHELVDIATGVLPFKAEPPVMWGTYTYRHHLDLDVVYHDEAIYLRKQVYPYIVINDIVSYDTTPGEFKVIFQPLEYPVHTIGWVVEHITSSDILPVVTSTLILNDDAILQDYPGYMTSRDDIPLRFRHTHTSFNYWSMGLEPIRVPTLNVDSGELLVNVNTDCPEHYRLRVRVYYNKHVEYITYPTSLHQRGEVSAKLRLK